MLSFVQPEPTPSEPEPQVVCWVMKDGIPHHIGHLDRCPRELDAFGSIVETHVTVTTSMEIVGGEDEAGQAVDGDEPQRSPSTDPDPANELYRLLIAEGNPPQLSITLATLYAEWKAAAVPETMGELRGLLGTLAGFFGSNGQAGGMLGKLMGKALKGGS